MRCFRTNVGVKHVKRVHVFNKCLRIELRNLACWLVFLRCSRNDFVVNVGDIRHEAHRIAAPRKIAPNDVKRHKGARVANVHIIVDGWSAHIHANFLVVKRCKGAFVTFLGVV